MQLLTAQTVLSVCWAEKRLLGVLKARSLLVFVTHRDARLIVVPHVGLEIQSRYLLYVFLYGSLVVDEVVSTFLWAYVLVYNSFV